MTRAVSTIRKCLRDLRSLACVASLLLAGACSPSNAPSGAVDKGATLVIGATREPRSLNPLLEEGEISEQLGLLLYTFLMTVDARGNQVPEAAREVPTARNGGISADGLRIVYHMRRDIRWEDGVPLTARDCAFTFAAIMNPRNNLPSRAGYEEIRSVTAPDDATVVVRLRRPYAPITDAFLAPDYNYPILPAHLLARYPNLNEIPFNVRPLGSGPFRVAQWQRGDHLTVVRNDGFFRGRARLARITIRFIPSFDTIVNQLKTGELDAAFTIDPRQFRRLRTFPGIATRLTPIAGALLLIFNNAHGPTTDVRVRRAIVAAIDIPSLVRDTTDNLYGSRDAMRGIFTWAYTPIAEPVYDPRAAARRLDEAGWTRAGNGTRSKNGEKLAIGLATLTTYPSELVTNLQQALAQIGVEATIKSYTPLLYLAPAAVGGPLRGLRFGGAYYRLLVGAGDPDTIPFFGCDQRAPVGFNLASFCDPALETAQQDGASHYSRSRRIDDARIVERRLREDVPLVVLAQTRELDAYTERLRGFEPAPYTPYWNVWNWSLSPR